jgi:FtsH-binding integral membrane protein
MLPEVNGENYGKGIVFFTMEFYAATKKNEMLSFAGKWMELENIILSEVSLAQKTKNHMFSLICGH